MADEIRALSTETSGATENILTIIDKIEQKSTNALTAIREVEFKTKTSQKIAKETGLLFTEIKNSSQESSMQVQQTASATDNWREYSKAIFNSYQDIETISEKLNSSSQELKEISHSLMDMVDEFKI
ncbi:methyl-accepting chemotaxis protein [Orenia metallireducens]|uniref:methyl-accepting chemotaxis protein n=1 Tax=Orenia metallireducens TaxID=1413210 RepID=UPI0009F562CD